MPQAPCQSAGVPHHGIRRHVPARNGKSVVTGGVRLSGEKYVDRLVVAPVTNDQVIGQALRRA